MLVFPPSAPNTYHGFLILRPYEKAGFGQLKLSFLSLDLYPERSPVQELALYRGMNFDRPVAEALVIEIDKATVKLEPYDSRGVEKVHWNRYKAEAFRACRLIIFALLHQLEGEPNRDRPLIIPYGDEMVKVVEKASGLEHDIMCTRVYMFFS